MAPLIDNIRLPTPLPLYV